MQIRFLPEADAEFAEARVWYGLQREGLDVALMQRVDEALQRIIDTPNAFPLIHRQLRRAIVKQFPFAILRGGCRPNCGVRSFSLEAQFQANHCSLEVSRFVSATAHTSHY